MGKKRKGNSSIFSLIVALVMAAIAGGVGQKCGNSDVTDVQTDTAETQTTDNGGSRSGRHVGAESDSWQQGGNDGSATQGRGNTKLMEMPATARGENIISHTGYVLSYNRETNCPNWVAWELTRSEAKGRGSRNPDFYPDPDVEGRSQVTTNDYSGSGYTRGHMCPSGDMRWSASAQHDCFYMSNMCPQTRELNAGSWEDLEKSCRRWAKQEGSVYIVCGPVFNDGRKVRYIGRSHKVRVPDGFFKVVLSLRKGNEKAIGFYYANNDRFQTMESAAMSVDEVERMTGYDFFYQVDQQTEDRVESRCNLREWE